MEKLIQYATKASAYDGPFDSVVGWAAAGMGYIIKTENGKIIVIDGGHDEDGYPLYEIIREKNPDVPYIMVTRPDYWTLPTQQEGILKRRDVIMSSYLKARAAGDKNVYFIDGMSFNVAPHQYEMSVDGVHPNDSGFVRMADSIGTFIRHALEKKER